MDIDHSNPTDYLTVSEMEETLPFYEYPADDYEYDLAEYYDEYDEWMGEQYDPDLAHREFGLEF